MEQKVNCAVHNNADGGKHLVFTIEGTQQCVGEIRLVGVMKYLLVISQLFSRWADMERGPARLPLSIHRAPQRQQAA